MDRVIFQDVLDRMEQSEHFRIVALGASNTERYMPGIHWVDVLELGLRARVRRKFQIIDSGVCGNNTRNALARFDRDVALFQPLAVFVTLGGNDCRTDSQRVPEEEFRTNLETIGEKIVKLNAIPIFQTYYKMDLKAMDPVTCPVSACRTGRYSENCRRWADSSSAPILQVRPAAHTDSCGRR